MNGVLGMVNIVLDTEMTSAQRDSLETAQRCAYSLLAILNDLLDFSKIEAGRMAIESIPFNLHTILTDCVRTYSTAALRKGIALHAEIDPNLPHVLEGDPLRLRQILTNLLSNAVKFTDKGTVHVRAHRAGSGTNGRLRVRIEIEDTGIGIAPEKHAEIFESFTQADNSISRRYGGTGLGLAITLSLVQLQGGTLELESTPGAGSLFRCTLEYGEHQSAGNADPQPASDTRRILVVEDNFVNQKLVSTILEKSGYAVMRAHNGAEALTLMETHRFQLVLMDVQMPVLDGLETTRRIRKDARFGRVPVVAMTARAMDGDREACLSAGMNAFVTKPIHAPHLLSVVEQFTNHSGQQAGAASA
jgi:CheY-like chemotaxis protein